MHFLEKTDAVSLTIGQVSVVIKSIKTFKFIGPESAFEDVAITQDSIDSKSKFRKA